MHDWHFALRSKKVGKLWNQFWFCTALLCLKSHMSSDLQHHNHPLSCQHAIFENISSYDLKCEKWFLEIHWQVSILFNGNNSPQKMSRLFLRQYHKMCYWLQLTLLSFPTSYMRLVIRRIYIFSRIQICVHCILCT